MVLCVYNSSSSSDLELELVLCVFTNRENKKSGRNIVFSTIE